MSSSEWSETQADMTEHCLSGQQRVEDDEDGSGGIGDTSTVIKEDVTVGAGDGVTVGTGDSVTAGAGDSVTVGAGDGVTMGAGDGVTVGAGDSVRPGGEGHSDDDKTDFELDPGCSSSKDGEDEAVEGATTSRDRASDGVSVTGEAIEEKCPQGMSKNQWKKHLRHQKWEAGREYRRQKRKEREGEKRKRRKLARSLEGPPSKRKCIQGGTVSQYKVAIELGFEHLMADHDISMLMKQCKRCYSENRKAPVGLQMYLTSFGDRCKQRMEAAVAGYQNWKVDYRSGDYVEEFGKDNIVFLAAESPNVLADLDPAKVYVIGGLVDHNHYKGYCFKDAVKRGVVHAQLPITDFIKLNSRKVLAVNHVFEILLNFVHTKDWKVAFHSVIPSRKVLSEKDKQQVEASGASTSNSAEAASLQEVTTERSLPARLQGGDF